MKWGKKLGIQLLISSTGMEVYWLNAEKVQPPIFDIVVDSDDITGRHRDGGSATPIDLH